MAMKGFRITDGKGFHVTFDNGWTVSVQFGRGNYGDNYDWPVDDNDYRQSNRDAGQHGSNTAEIAAWKGKDHWHHFENGDTVQGHQTPAQVLALMNEISALPALAKAEGRTP